MKLTFIGILTLIAILPNSVFACSPSFLSKEDIIKVLRHTYGADTKDFKFLSFKSTRYFGESDRQMCPRFTIRGKAKVQFTNNEMGTCTLTAKENFSGKYYYDIKLKNIVCN